MEITESLHRLKEYCERENYKGWDPYDGLNSRLFQATPLKHWDIARLILIQVMKRSPINFRPLLRVPKRYNAKGLGLFLNGYCNLYRLTQRGETRFGSKRELLENIDQIAALLISQQSSGYSGACWGYGFDWQSRAFFIPKHTPTVVATSFAVDALFNAYTLTNRDQYLDVALSAARFVTHDLNLINKPDGLFMFSYSPLDKRAVYNATLLGTKILGQVYRHTGDQSLWDLAHRSAKAVSITQNSDGSFPHSDQVGEAWRDSFHTAFKLECLKAYEKDCKDDSFHENIERGFRYWVTHYFDEQTGYAYYFDRGMSPGLVDLHCAAQALATIVKLGKAHEYWDLIEKIAEWPVANMQSDQGYFYFQRRGKRVNRTPYMRWPNAWMFYGLSYYLLERGDHDKA